MKLFQCLGLACAALAYSQDAQNPRPEIHGTVLEFGTHFGLAGAQVDLLQEGQKQPVASTTTDSQGVFVFHPDTVGHYDVQVKMDGYKAVQGAEVPGALVVTAMLLSAAPATIQTHVVITTGNPKEEAHFLLVRPAELRGRVIDDETGEPLAKVPVSWVTLNPTPGARSYAQGMPILTGDDGQFVLPSMLPGDYAVATLPRVLGGAQILTQFSEDDLKTVDQDFEKAFWPGGHDLDSVALLAVGSGQSVSVGTIKVRNAAYYRVHVNFAPVNCPAGEKARVQFRLAPQAAGDQIAGEVPCGSDFLIRNVQPGSYQLQLSAGRTPETRVQDKVPVEVRDRNLDLPVALDRGVDLDGRVVVADEAAANGPAPPPLNELTVQVQLVEGLVFGSPPLNPDPQGQFHLVNVPFGRQSVSLLRARDGFYLREIRYNGHAQPDNAFTLDPNSAAQLLELVIDNQPAAITGVVEDNDNPVNKPYVVVTKWPYSAGMVNLSLRKIPGGDDGRFQFRGLSPGEYRILAVSDDNKDQLNQPGVLDRLLPAAEKITLDRAAVQDVHLKLTDPFR
jgi:hypothetical protein